MRSTTLALSALMMLCLATLGCNRASAEMGDPAIGKAAPAFTAVDSNGKTHELSSFKGKFVVLEWLNHGCPYVKKHYGAKNMQALQAEFTGKDVVWLSIISSAEGKQGYSTPEEANAGLAAHGAKPTALLLDPKGEVGKLYGAKTTPHMFVIDPAGNLIYKGAIDSVKSTDADDIPGATNYVRAALTEAMAGKPVTTTETKPYGCSVKY